MEEAGNEGNSPGDNCSIWNMTADITARLMEEDPLECEVRPEALEEMERALKEDLSLFAALPPHPPPPPPPPPPSLPVIDESETDSNRPISAKTEPINIVVEVNAAEMVDMEELLQAVEEEAYSVSADANLSDHEWLSRMLNTDSYFGFDPEVGFEF